MQKGRKVPLPPDVQRAIIEGSPDDLKVAIRALLDRAILPTGMIVHTESLPDTPPYERGYLTRYQDRRR